MIKPFSQKWEWDDVTLLAFSEYSDAILSDTAKKNYPMLGETLDQTHRMVDNSMDDEYDNLLAFAREELEVS